MDKDYTVLVADDSMWARKTVVDCLANTEFRVVGLAADGRTAVEKFSELAPDITILDLIMPDTDGFATLNRIMEANPEASVLMLSSMASTDAVTECLTIGAKDFMQKPFEREQLILHLRRLVGGLSGAVPRKSVGTKSFAEFLLERGTVAREHMLDAVTHQKEVNLSLCALAVEKGFLTEDRIGALDNEQRRTDRKFATVAETEGWLSAEQLEELARVKKERWLFLGEALVKLGYLGSVQLEQLRREYRLSQSPARAELRTAIGEMPEKDIVSTVLDATLKILLHFTKELVRLVAVSEGIRETPKDAHVFTQRVTGDVTFDYALVLPETLALCLAGAITGIPAKRMNQFVQDVISEFLSIVIGSSCIALNMNAYHVRAEPPHFLTTPRFVELVASTRKAVSARLRTDEGEFDILLCFVATR